MTKVVLIGAGNLAWHLGRRLYACGLHIAQVYNRSLSPAQALAVDLNARAVTNLEEIEKAAHLYVLAVSDGAILEVARRLATKLSERLIVHTSGATPSAALKPYFQRHGVFYPLQTFTKGCEVNFSEIPICVYAAQKKDEDFLEQSGRLISEKVYRINDQERSILHVAAVFANNFSNHCFQMGYHTLQQENLPFELLTPLIQETARKIIGRSPLQMQTGPAARNDLNTVKRHLDYLEKIQSPYAEIYRRLSESINPLLMNNEE